MPSMDSSLAAFDRLNLNESDVISHLCSVAVEKCQSKTERRLAGCGGHHMRKRVLIKNFVSELMKKQQDIQSEEGMEQEEGTEDEQEEVVEEREEEIELEEDDEQEEEVDLNENLMMNEKGRREEDEDERIQRAGREWYHHHHYGHPDGGYSSPSPPLDEDEREKSMWSLPACTSPDSMALHLRDPYETSDGGALYQSSDPYSFSSSFSLSPPSDDENTSMGAPWHDADLSSSYLARPPSRLDCSPPYSLYDDMYSSCSSPTLPPVVQEAQSIHHEHHYEMATQLLDPSYDTSSVRVVAAGESDNAFLAMGEDRPLQEMRSYATMASWSCSGGEAVLFDLSSSAPPSPSPSSPSTPSTPSKKRRSDEMSLTLDGSPLVDDHSKRIKL